MPAVALRYAQTLSARGRVAEAGRTLARAAERHPDDPRLLLALLRLESPGLSSGAVEAALWSLVGRHPGNEEACRLLASRLLARGDLQGLRQVLHLFVLNSGGREPAWLLSYRGVADALRGEMQKAVESFSAVLAHEKSWALRYDRGLVLAGMGRYKEAEKDFIRAGSLLDEERGREVRAARSLIRTRIAELRWAQGDRVGARREVEYAIDLDTANLRARLWRRKLERSGQTW